MKFLQQALFFLAAIAVSVVMLPLFALMAVLSAWQLARALAARDAENKARQPQAFDGEYYEVDSDEGGRYREGQLCRVVIPLHSQASHSRRRF